MWKRNGCYDCSFIAFWKSRVINALRDSSLRKIDSFLKLKTRTIKSWVCINLRGKS